MRSPLSTSAVTLVSFALLILGCEGGVPTEFAIGQLAIVTTTSGDEPDPDGYNVQVDGEPSQPIAATGQLQPSTVSAGDHTVTLSGIAANCSAAEGPMQTVTVSARTLATVRYTVTCSAAAPTAARWTHIPLPSSVTAAINFYQGRTLWGTSASDLFVIAQTGGASGPSAVWHYDGAGWTKQVSGPDSLFVFNAIWGFSGNDVYAVGNRAYYDPIYPAVAMHFDGSRWSETPLPLPPAGSGVSTTAYTVWGPGPSEAYLAGSSYEGSPATEFVARYDGSTWSRMALPVFGDFTALTDMSGTSGSDLWAIGSRQNCEDCNYWIATIVHYDGQVWTEQFSRNADVYTGVWAVAPNDVWVVGQNDEDNANVLHYDGAGWTRAEPLPPNENGLSENGLQDVWASAGNDVYAVGPGVLLHYDGTSWSKLSDQGGNRIWGTSANDVFILRADEILQRSR